MHPPLRLRRHCETAAAVAEFLHDDPRVTHVAYPGLADDPGHALAAAQLTGGFGGVVSLALSGEHADRVPLGLADLRWMLAEYRVGLFAQSLGTARPVSAERIDKAVASALAPRSFR